MPDKKSKSPQNSQPKRKKRRVKSNQETKENKGDNQKQNESTDLLGVSTIEYQNTPNTQSSASELVYHSIGHTPLNISQFQNPQPMQLLGMQGMQSNMMFPYSPPAQGAGAPMGMSMGQPPNYKPEWATELIENVKQMGKDLSKLNSIEKTLSSISLKINSLETKVGVMETKVNNCETACNFLSDTYDEHKKDLETAKTEIKNAKSEISGLKTRCDAIENRSREYQTESSKLQRKVYELESRSMRDNLVFHGLPKSANENCDLLVKTFCKEKLEMEATEVDRVVFDRIHRIGRLENLRPGNIRPIVAKFHRYNEREKVRQIGYEKRAALKGENMAVRPQLPSEILEKRKPLYPVFEKAKNDGHRVKFVLDKLYINGREYIPPL